MHPTHPDPLSSNHHLTPVEPLDAERRRRPPISRTSLLRVRRSLARERSALLTELVQSATVALFVGILAAWGLLHLDEPAAPTDSLALRAEGPLYGRRAEVALLLLVAGAGTLCAVRAARGLRDCRRHEESLGSLDEVPR